MLSASANDNTIAWYENRDGRGSFGPRHTITWGANNAQAVYAADLDRDGDTDVLSASWEWGSIKIAWYENTDGRGNFGLQRIISPPSRAELWSVYAADLDGDSDMDVLSASGLLGDCLARKHGRPWRLWATTDDYHTSEFPSICLCS